MHRKAWGEKDYCLTKRGRSV